MLLSYVFCLLFTLAVQAAHNPLAFSHDAVILDRTLPRPESVTQLAKAATKFSVTRLRAGSSVTVSLGKAGTFLEYRDCSEIETFLLKANSNNVVPLIGEVAQVPALGDYVIIADKSDTVRLPAFQFFLFESQACQYGWPQSSRKVMLDFLKANQDRFSFVAVRQVV